MTRISVLIAEDEPEIRELLAEVIRHEPSMELAGTAADADGAIALATDLQPDVALVDVEMPGGGGTRATRAIRMCCPGTRVVALSAHTDRTSVLEMVRAGAAGYLVKGTPLDEVLETIRRAVRGEGALSPKIAGDVIDELSGHLRRERRDQRQLEERVARIRGILSEPGGLAMAFQPIFDLRSHRVVGLEALARFAARPARGPDAWFREAEDVGLRVELELAAARIALDAMRGLPLNAYLALNLSPDVAASPQFLDMLATVAADRVVVEVTEHARVENYEELEEFARGLRTKGTRLAVDDAGAGFSSFRHIIRLAPDIIKMDVSLTSGIDADQARRAFGAALIAFASEIGATLVAEGIETRGELEALRELGVGYGQGFYLARPGPLPSVVHIDQAR